MIEIVVRESLSMGTNCYGVSDGESYIIIDPAVSYKKMDEICNGKIVGVLITHGHFDHIEELQSYLDNTCVKIYGHINCLEKLQNSMLNCSGYFGDELVFNCKDRFVPVSDGECIKLLNEDIKVLENFGHTNCCISFIIDNNMFCGDFIFAFSIGRTDLPTASNEQMRDSLDVIKKYKVDYLIYPGHGNKTTLNIEKNRNPYLKC